MEVTNEIHKQIIEPYILMCIQFTKEISTKAKYQAYLEVLDTVLEYHNNYGKGTTGKNFWDWLMIIPINLSVMTNGFFAGIETKNNRAILRAYKVVLDDMLTEVVKKIDNFETIDD